MSGSPKRTNIVNANEFGSRNASPNKNFMSKLPATSGTTSDDLAQRDMQPIMEAKLTSIEKNRNNVMNLTQPVISSKAKQPTSRVTS